ncbi:TetR/AcrR family transcriptional regulator [Acidaminobacterium chupaoyuni]
MAQFTKRAIIESFVMLLNEMPFDKITVKDIVDRCGVNRNTFYYYFQDIYALLDEVFRTETEKVILENNLFDSWQEGILQSIGFVFENKTAIRHLYGSLNRERLERYLYDVTGSIMMRYVEKEAEGLDAAPEDIKVIAEFYKFALVGMALDWIGSGMKHDVSNVINRMGILLDGSIRAALERSIGPREQLPQ